MSGSSVFQVLGFVGLRVLGFGVDTEFTWELAKRRVLRYGPAHAFPFKLGGSTKGMPNFWISVSFSHCFNLISPWGHHHPQYGLHNGFYCCGAIRLGVAAGDNVHQAGSQLDVVFVGCLGAGGDLGAGGGGDVREGKHAIVSLRATLVLLVLSLLLWYSSSFSARGLAHIACITANAKGSGSVAMLRGGYLSMPSCFDSHGWLQTRSAQSSCQ